MVDVTVHCSLNDGLFHELFSAKYMKPTIHSNPEAMNLTCKSDGGYPEGTLRWFGGNEELTASQMKASQGENGLFQLSSTLFLGEGSSVSTYTCRVFNASGGREQETLFPVPDPKTAGICPTAISTNFHVKSVTKTTSKPTITRQFCHVSI